MRTTTLAAAALLLLTLTGCTHRSEALPLPPAPTTTTTTTTSTPSTPTTAADGRNLQACQDGTCEVEIMSGDTITIEGQTVTVPNVSAGGLTFVLPGGTVASVAGPGSTIGIGDTITIDILAHDGSTAIIKVY